MASLRHTLIARATCWRWTIIPLIARQDVREKKKDEERKETRLAGEVGARRRLHEQRRELGRVGRVALDGGGAVAERAARVAEPRRLVHVLVQPRRAAGEVERRDEARQAAVRAAQEGERGPEGRQRQERRRGGRRRQRPVQVVEPARQSRVEGGRRRRALRRLLHAHGLSLLLSALAEAQLNY
jgi:hypothetical protein